mmetsp:Transcript_22758/g.20000  ORF Transcript_22758/g.20000 Transcript_22758/m.20000 type:complete len:157 (-) Transcript_22758:88-558(-)
MALKREDSLETVNTSSSANTAATSNNSNIKQPQPFDWIKEILKEQGVNEYDSAILDILHDYSYHYLSSILKEAAENLLHRTEPNKQEYMDKEDIEFAKSQIHKTRTYSPNLLEMMEDAAQVNRIPLPFVSHHHKMKLPPKPYRLTSQNFQLDHDDK